jgi:hypothetical protein
MVNAELTRADPGLIHKDPAKEHIANREQSMYIDGMPLFRAPALRSAGKGAAPGAPFATLYGLVK